MTATAKHDHSGGPGRKEKQEKPSVQTREEERALKEAEERAHHGGRDEWPDEDVNPARDIHVEEGEEAAPAEADTHDARQRKDKTEKDKTDGKKKPRED
ncbi:hypothetical protein [Hyphococcus sp.]|uniref:hypothetical protein n=1 Tax=Hyphococcus sp. TaxID=2038636 RepID=UPI0035C6680D